VALISFCRDHKPPARVIAAWSTAGAGLWYMNRISPPSKVDWVEAGVVSPVVRKQNGCGRRLQLNYSLLLPSIENKCR
jgi:hypothetical protein